MWEEGSKEKKNNRRVKWKENHQFGENLTNKKIARNGEEKKICKYYCWHRTLDC